MFDSWSEIFVIALVALVVIGPKDLPKVLRTIGQWVGKAKRVSYEFKLHVDDMVRESELDEVRQQIQSAANTDPAAYAQNTIDPDKKLREAIEFGGEELVNVKLPENAPVNASVNAPTAPVAPAAIPAPVAGERKEP
jgi:sec-independent protein translocase protein TatB